MDISLLILTHNRKDFLNYTLTSICQQITDDIEYEVIVVDDGSTDDTRELIKAFKNKIKNLQYIYHEHIGVKIAECRNCALRAALGDIVCFVDAGVVLKDDFLKQHYRMHKIENAPDVVIGRIAAFEICMGDEEFEQHFHDEDLQETVRQILKIERFEDRRMTTYQYFKNTFRNMPAPWHYFWTCNVSWKRKGRLEKAAFDEQIQNWGMEDVEFGYHLKQEGASFEYNPDAVAVHIPHDSQEAVVKKGRQDMENLKYFYNKYRNVDAEIYLCGRMYLHNEYLDFLKKRLKERLTAGQIPDMPLSKDKCVIFGGGPFGGKREYKNTVLLDCDSEYEKRDAGYFISSIGACTGFDDQQFENVVIWDYWVVLHNDLLWNVLKEAFRVGKEVYILFGLKNENEKVVMCVSEEKEIELLNILCIMKKKYKIVKWKSEVNAELAYFKVI